MKLCECGCGQPTQIARKNLIKRGHVKGQPLRFIKGHNSRWHGYSRSGTYHSWRAMIYRCEKPDFHDYPTYGGRGIRVCDRWHSLRDFIADMGERPPGKTLDRYPNNDGDYEPGNCRWATLKEQAKNRRTTKYLSAFGKTKAMDEWVHETGLLRVTIEGRLLRGWSEERALATKPAINGSFNANKTHCKHGHLLAGNNVRPDRKNPHHRICRACARIAAHQQRQAKKLN